MVPYPRIYLYDSGSGLLPTARAGLKRGLRFRLHSDLKYSPYGAKKPKWIKRRTELNIEHLHSQTPPGTLSIVAVVCNTATIHALNQLKAEGKFIDTPDRITFGVVEPVVDNLVADLSCKAAIICATPVSVQSHEFARRIEALRADMEVIEIPFPRLAETIDRQEISQISPLIFGPINNSPQKLIALKKKFRNNEIRVALCCTHYPLFEDQFRSSFNFIFGYQSRYATHRDLKFISQPNLVVEKLQGILASMGNLGPPPLCRASTTGDPTIASQNLGKYLPAHCFEGGRVAYEKVIIEDPGIKAIQAIRASGATLAAAIGRHKVVHGRIPS